MGKCVLRQIRIMCTALSALGNCPPLAPLTCSCSGEYSIVISNGYPYNSVTYKTGFQLAEKGLPDTFWHRSYLA